MKKQKQRFPIGTLVQATIPRMGKKPHVLLGLVISHVNQEEECCEVFLGPNPWLPRMHIVPIIFGRLKSVSRPYTKGG